MKRFSKKKPYTSNENSLQNFGADRNCVRRDRAKRNGIQFTSRWAEKILKAHQPSGVFIYHGICSYKLAQHQW